MAAGTVEEFEVGHPNDLEELELAMLICATGERSSFTKSSWV